MDTTIQQNDTQSQSDYEREKDRLHKNYGAAFDRVWAEVIDALPIESRKDAWDAVKALIEARYLMGRHMLTEAQR